MTIKEKVRELIDLGYDDDVIVMTLGISIQDLNLTKKQMQNNIKENKAKSNLQLLREIYNEIYCSKSSTKISKIVCLSNEQILEIQNILNEVETKMKILFTSSDSDQNKIIKFVIDKLSPLDYLYLPLDMAERAYKLFPKASRIRKIKNIKYREALSQKRSIYASNLSNTINNCISENNTIEGLTELLNKTNIFFPDKAYNSSSLPSLQNSIKEKIKKIKNSQLDQLQDINDEIRDIVKLIVDRNANESKIEKLIEQEVQKYLNMRKNIIDNNKSFTYLEKNQTLENARRQINHKIKKLIEESKTIIDVDDTYQRLVNLFGDIYVPSYTIINNLILNNRFEEASEFLKKNFENRKELEIKRMVRQYKIEIKSAQIAYFIMKGINAPEGSLSDENKYYQMISEGIEKSKISPKQIVLGKTKDGLRTITWNDLKDKINMREI